MLLSGVEPETLPLCSSRNNPYPPHGRSLEIPRGRGVLKVKILEAMYEAKLEFPGGTGGAKRKNLPWGELMDISWNCTFDVILNCADQWLAADLFLLLIDQ